MTAASWSLITTKVLELRKRRALMIVTVLFTVGLPVVVLGLRLLFHAVDPRSYGPASDPGVFSFLGSELAEFGFIVAVLLGTTTGTTDLTDGVFRHLVITGRSRLALFFAKIPAGLSILLPLAAAGFAIVCLVTAFLGAPPPASVNESGVPVPVHLSQSQLQTWIAEYPAQSGTAFGTGAPPSLATARSMAETEITFDYAQYTHDEEIQLNPSVSEMTDAGLWIELDLLVGFTVGLGLGSLMGQRTVPVTLLLVLDIIVTPSLADHAFAYFINVERAVAGIALDQLQPQALIGQGIIGHVVNHAHGGEGPALERTGQAILPVLAMPTWALITVIAGWIAGWIVIGAWRTVTRDA